MLKYVLVSAASVIRGSPIQSLKENIQYCLETNDLGSIVSLARENRKVLSQLVRMAYDKETLVGWRAIKAVGLAAKEIVKTDDEFLREAMRKLLWSLSDESGGIGWSAPELLGEIVSADPKRFSDFIPLIAQVYDVEEEVFRPGVVYALARIAETTPEQVAMYQKIIIQSLADKDPLLRTYGLDLVERLWTSIVQGNLWSTEYRRRVMSLIEKIVNSREVVWIYKDNGFISFEVGEKSKKLLRIITMK